MNSPNVMTVQKNSLHKMDLHETIDTRNKNSYSTKEVFRVPGGWVYIIYYKNDVTSCFVPFSKEFKVYEANV